MVHVPWVLGAVGVVEPPKMHSTVRGQAPMKSGSPPGWAREPYPLPGCGVPQGSTAWEMSYPTCNAISMGCWVPSGGWESDWVGRCRLPSAHWGHLS